MSERDWKANATIISGNIGNLLDKTDNCKTVLRGPSGFNIPNVLTITINYGLIDGFQIRDAYSADNTNAQGANAAVFAGQYCKKFTVRNCLIIDNDSRESAVHAISATVDSELNLENCTIRRCTGRRGIGTIIESDGFKMTATISNCLYYENTITNLANFGSGSNGVININANHGLDVKIINTTIARNSNVGQSSANARATIQYFTSGSNGIKSIAVDNCILWSNSGDTVGFYRHTSSSGAIDAKVRNCISEKSISSNSAVLTNVTQQDPKFQNVLNFDFTLTAGSPAIDAGAASGVVIAAKDLAGNNRVANGQVDMGCYEFGANTSINNMKSSGHLALYPNPANSILNIASSASINQIEIISLQGKQALLETSNNHQINIGSLPKGIYILKANTSKGMVYSKFIKN